MKEMTKMFIENVYSKCNVVCSHCSHFKACYKNIYIYIHKQIESTLGCHKPCKNNISIFAQRGRITREAETVSERQR